MMLPNFHAPDVSYTCASSQCTVCFIRSRVVLLQCVKFASCTSYMWFYTVRFASFHASYCFAVVLFVFRGRSGRACFLDREHDMVVRGQWGHGVKHEIEHLNFPYSCHQLGNKLARCTLCGCMSGVHSSLSDLSAHRRWRLLIWRSSRLGWMQWMEQSEGDTRKGPQRRCDKVGRRRTCFLTWIPSLLHQYCIVHVVRVVASYFIFFCIMPKGCMFHRCARKKVLILILENTLMYWLPFQNWSIQ